MLRPTDYVIDDYAPEATGKSIVVNGEVKGRGYVERDYNLYPEEMFDAPSEIPLIPQGEWTERIRDKEGNKACLSHLSMDWPSLDQNGQGYCWAYSTTSAIMMGRSRDNQPYVRLSAHATACMIKGFRDEGGWCGLSAQRQISHGTPSVAFWPEKSMSRSNDKPEVWANAALHKVTEDWIDLTASVYDRNLTFAQMMTCLLNNMPCALDFNWWGHSVAGADAVDGVASFNGGMLRIKDSGKLMTYQQFDSQWNTDFTAGFAPRIRNSWADSWGDKGFGVLAGSKGIPNGAVCLRVSTPSLA